MLGQPLLIRSQNEKERTSAAGCTHDRQHRHR